MNSLNIADYIVFFVYFVIVASYGYWVYNRKKKAVTDTHDFFLAEGSLTWWAIGASMIASNISAEQFIGMSGDGFFVGTAVAAYEWIAALALIIIAIWFMPGCAPGCPWAIAAWLRASRACCKFWEACCWFIPA